MNNVNILTIDLEDWFHSLEPNPQHWNSFERRIEKPTIEILNLLNRYNAKATFFVLGDVASHHPVLIKQITAEGHDIGSHAINHFMVYNQSPKEFESEVTASIELISSVIGKKVISFRAPYFSITKNSLWGLDILQNLGIKIDSSVFPIYNHRYGIRSADRVPSEIRNGLWEYPISTFRFANINIPFSGGVYFRFYPYFLFNIFKNKFQRKDEVMIFYLHPWECDPDQPIFKTNSPFLNFRHYHALAKTYSKLEKLLSENRFVSLEFFHENYTLSNG